MPDTATFNYATPKTRAPIRSIVGTVASDKADKTIKVVVIHQVRHPKYGKFLKTRIVLHAHDETNEAKEGDTVEIAECRPLSKMKHHRLIQIVKRAPERAIQISAEDITTGKFLRDPGGRDVNSNTPQMVSAPPPQVVDGNSPFPISWDSWLTLRHFAVILDGTIAGTSRSGEAMPWKAQATQGEFQKNAVARMPNAVDVECMLTARDGVALVENVAPTAEELRQVAGLRTVYVQINPNDPQRGLNLAASLVPTLRQLIATSMYPVVIGPITDDLFDIADAAYSLSVRVTPRGFEQYIANEGRLRGPAAKLR